MKRFREFKSDQQYIAEMGPIGAAIMGAMGLWGAWKTFKKVKETIKGYRESRAEKIANEDSGVDIEIKKIVELRASYIDTHSLDPDIALPSAISCFFIPHLDIHQALIGGNRQLIPMIDIVPIKNSIKDNHQGNSFIIITSSRFFV